MNSLGIEPPTDLVNDFHALAFNVRLDLDARHGRIDLCRRIGE